MVRCAIRVARYAIRLARYAIRVARYAIRVARYTISVERDAKRANIPVLSFMGLYILGCILWGSLYLMKNYLY